MSQRAWPSRCHGYQPTLRTGASWCLPSSGRTTRKEPASATAPATQYDFPMRVQSSRIMSTVGPSSHNGPIPSIMERMETQKQMVPGSAGRRLFSVGHSNHDLERFMRLLQNAGITAVADVRSRPYSGRFPHFNGPELERELPRHGIAYLFLGDSLGGRPGQPSLYDAEGRVDYRRVRKTQAFEEGLDRLCQELERSATAMLCSEEDPLHCHRGLMIAPAML